MLSFLRSMLSGLGRVLGYPLAYGWHWGASFCRGAWEAYCPPPPPPSDLDRVVELLERRTGAEAAVERAVERRPRREPVTVASQQRDVQERALRYTAAVMHGGPRPSLDGVPEPLARKLARLDTRVACAPIHRELVRVTGRECRDGWWSGKADDDPGSAPPAIPAPRFA